MSSTQFTSIADAKTQLSAAWDLASIVQNTARYLAPSEENQRFADSIHKNLTELRLLSRITRQQDPEKRLALCRKLWQEDDMLDGDSDALHSLRTTDLKSLNSSFKASKPTFEDSNATDTLIFTLTTTALTNAEEEVFKPAFEKGFVSSSSPSFIERSMLNIEVMKELNKRLGQPDTSAADLARLNEITEEDAK